ncbi:ATP-binding protein [Kitasatospora sp. NPDC052896]|uniref:ATP-binding protein n=1 Tax=Kitasatospora sp. NPDC052896 TaxID=3364061 RepID=UPI0037C82109
MILSSPVVVGRDHEQSLLDAALACARRGEGRAVFLLGEAGLGKSRLAEECAHRAGAAGMAVLRGRSSATGAPVPFRPIAESLFSLFRAGGPPKEPSLAPYRSALAGLVPEWRDAAPPGASPSILEIAEAFIRLLASVAHDPADHRAAGCLLVVEDLHDADAETLSVIEYLVDNVGGLPVLLLATLRPEAGPAAELVRSVGRRRSATLAELRPLDRSAVRELTERCLAAESGRLPEPLIEKLARDSDGNPFVIEELLSGMADSGALCHRADGEWQVSDDLDIDIPLTVVHSVAQRVDRLGPGGRELLYAAAVQGRRFALPVVKLVTGLDDRSLLVHLRAGVEAQLVSPSGPMADQYEFRHALTIEALLAGLLPVERADLARRAADAVEQAYPGLPGDWRQQVALLRLAAGQPMAAALLFAEAGRTALGSGALGSAVALLERAHELTAVCDPADPSHAAERTAVLESLVHALAESGRLDRALALGGSLPISSPGALDDARSAALHTRLAWAAVFAGRLAEAAAQAALVRGLLGRFDGSAHTPAVDIVEAHLILGGHGAVQGDRRAEAERLARYAAERAEQAGLPEVACQAWQLLALLERRHGFDRADACLERIRALASRHRLPTWRVDALIRLGGNEFIRSGSSAGIERAHRAALDLGSLGLMHATEAAMAAQAVQRGEYQQAHDLTERCREATARLGSVETHQFVLVTRAALAAHQGRRREMEQELAEFRRWDGDESLHPPLVHGNCQAICALLEENHDRALVELDNAWRWEEQNPTVFYLNGRYGLRPLLRALAGLSGPEELASITAEHAAGLRWNRQFERLAHAVHEGRAGRPDAALRAFEQAQEAARPFLMARHLGLRLVAGAALEDGWGDPVSWLRTAENHFHAAEVPAVAGACRKLIRRAGASVPQRRAGSAAVPAELRRQGLTGREYEVFQLVAHRYGNQDIARRLHISPRTVEKHVASILAKTGQPHRTALSDYAAEAADRHRTTDSDSPVG